MNVYIPTTKKCISVELATLILDRVVRRYSVPFSVVIDRGLVFIS